MNNPIPFVTIVFSLMGIVLLTMFVTWVAYGTVQMLRRRDAREAARHSDSMIGSGHAVQRDETHEPSETM